MCEYMSKNALMTVKTASGIKRFQEDKNLGNWFGKLLPVISSMANSQPSQAIEPGMSTEVSTPTENEGEIDESDTEDLENATSVTSEDAAPLKRQGTKRKYVPTPSAKKVAVKSETILQEIKGTVESLKNLSSENSSKEILDFLKEESKRQAEREKSFFQLMSQLLQPQAQPQLLPVQQFQQSSNHPPMYPTYVNNGNYNNNQASSNHDYRFGMTSNIQPNLPLPI